MNETFAVPVVSLIVESPQRPDCILLQLRSKAEKPGLEDLYELPQGRMRDGESIAECARRELAEETGIHLVEFRNPLNVQRVRSEELTSFVGLIVSEKGQHAYLAACIVCLATGTPRNSLESREPRWYSRSETLALLASDRIFPLNVPMIRAYYGLPSSDV